MVKLGIIGGSGAREIVKGLGLEARVETAIVNDSSEVKVFYHTPRGVFEQLNVGFKATVDYLHFIHAGTEVYFTFRHNQDHSKLPAELDQRGIVAFLKQKEVDAVILVSATGSLDTNIKLIDEGGIVIPDGLMRGVAYQVKTFAGKEGYKQHVPLAEPFSPQVRKLLLDSAAVVPGVTAYDGGLYVQNEGNNFESPAEIAALYCTLNAPAIVLQNVEIMRASFATQGASESNPQVQKALQTLKEQEELYQRLGKSLRVQHAQVGMTAVREAILLLEAGINVGLATFPVNYGEGLLLEPISHERTCLALSRATEPYIVPFLQQVIKKASGYLIS